MERVIVTEGTKVNLYRLFEDLQDYTKTNAKNICDILFESYGVNVEFDQQGNPLSTDSSLLVSGVGGENFVTVYPGQALTSSLGFINVPTQQVLSLTSLTYSGPGDDPHYLYIKHKQIEDTPIGVASGFVYGLGVTDQVNSRAHDNYEFVWDNDPTVSGFQLATVHLDSFKTNAQLPEDTRDQLVLSKSVLPGSTLYLNRTSLQQMQGDLTVPNLTINTLLTLGGTTLSGSTLSSIKTNNHAQNTDTGTTNSTFTVNGINVLTATDLATITAWDAANVKLTGNQKITGQKMVDGGFTVSGTNSGATYFNILQGMADTTYNRLRLWTTGTGDLFGLSSETDIYGTIDTDNILYYDHANAKLTLPSLTYLGSPSDQYKIASQEYVDSKIRTGKYIWSETAQFTTVSGMVQGFGYTTAPHKHNLLVPIGSTLKRSSLALFNGTTNLVSDTSTNYVFYTAENSSTDRVIIPILYGNTGTAVSLKLYQTSFNYITSSGISPYWISILDTGALGITSPTHASLTLEFNI